jgi:hypothetical protein
MVARQHKRKNDDELRDFIREQIDDMIRRLLSVIKREVLSVLDTEVRRFITNTALFEVLKVANFGAYADSAETTSSNIGQYDQFADDDLGDAYQRLCKLLHDWTPKENNQNAQ